MAILDSKEDMIKIVLTSHGRKKLAQGDFRVHNFAFFDDEVDYEVTSGYVSGSDVSDPLPILLNAVLWLRSDLGISTDENGNVYEWQDQTEYKNHARQTNDALRPYLSSSSAFFNNRPALNFGGEFTDDYLLIDDDEVFRMSHDLEIYVILRNYSNGSNDVIFAKWNPENEWQIRSDTTDSLRVLLNDGSNRTVTDGAMSTGSISIAQMRFDSSSDTLFGRVDQGALSSNSWGTPVTSSTNVSIGADATGDGTAQCEIAEIIVFNRLLEEVEREALFDYFYDLYIPIQTPLQLFGGNLYSWWRADTGVTLSASTGVVETWTDQINSFDADATAGELVFTGSVANQEAINFSGAASPDDDGLDIGGSTDDFEMLHNGSGSLIAVVFNRQETGTGQYVIDNIRATAARTGFAFFVTSDDIMEARVGNSTGTFASYASSSLPNPLGKNYVIFVHGNDASPNARMFVNKGNISDFSEDYASAPVPGNSTLSLKIGARSAGSSADRIQGNIAEVIIVNSLPTDDEISRLADYIEDRYGDF